MKFTGERFIPGQEVEAEIKIEHLQRYQAVTKLVKGKVVLDAASGEGYGSALIAEYARGVYGLDISKEAIEEARRKYSKDNLEYIEGSVTNIPLEDKSIDIVVSFETIEHIDENAQLAFIKEVKRVLKEDGVVVISTPNKKIYSDEFNYNNEFHIREFYKDEFIKLVTSEFKHYELYCQFKEEGYYLTKDGDSILDKTGTYNEDFAKYYICIACNKAIESVNLSSVTIQDEKQHIKNVHRILSLQEEVELRNRHLKEVDEEIKVKGERIVQLQEEVEERNFGINKLNNQIDEQQKHICNLEKENKQLVQYLEERAKQVEERNREIEEKNKEIEERTEQLEVKQKQSIIISDELELIKFELEQKKQNLETIYHSTGWKILLRLYKIRDVIFPKDSKRRVFAKLTKKVIRNPKFYIKNINKENLKKFSTYMKDENPESVSDRLDNYELKKQEPIQVQEIEIITSENNNENLVFKYEQNPMVSIIIPVYNQYEYTYNCLKSILQNTEGVTYEVIIADDVSSDDTVNIGRYVENINIIRNTSNLGFLLNCNNAAKQARGKYIHFLNNDTQVQPGWLSSLIELIESDDSIGMVGSKLVYPNGQLQEAGGILWEDGSAWNYGRNDDPEKSEYNYVKEADYISGASILLSKALWQEIGGFDERYVPAYCEDSDLAFEVRKHGYKVVYQPKSVIVHFEGISNGTDTSVGLKAYQVTNQKKFYEKWEHILKVDHFPNAENVFVARDKRSKKKTILVIDHYVPHYDKDAGSRTVYQYLKMFVKQGFNVKFIGDNFFRHEPYTTTLQQLGIEVLYGPYYAQNYEKWIKANANHIDYVFCNRPHITEKYMDFLVENTKAKIIYYGHDLHFLREMREYELTGDKRAKENSEHWKERELQLMRQAEVAYYPSQIEADIIHEIDPTISVKAIPAYIFDENRESIKYDANSRSGVMFIGGFGHKPNVDAVVWYVKEVLPHVLEKNNSIRTYILGSNPPKEILELASENVFIKGFVTDKELEQFYKKCRISIVPLRYGAGIKGKVIEGMYNQIPILTTCVGAEGILNSEDSLVIVDDPKQYAETLVEMYDDDERLSELSVNSLKYVKENYTMRKVEEIIGEDFRF